MKIIDFEVISKMNISPTDCYQWVSEMIEKKGEAILPPKISLKPFDGVFCNVMPSIVGEAGGIKVVTRYPERVPALESFLSLFDVQTGEVLALMDATWITAMRTGAVAAHAIIHLAKSDFSTLGIVGLGNTSRATMLVLAEVLKDRKLTVNLLRYKEQELDFAERFSQYENLTFQMVDTPEALVTGSDVVISGVTYAGVFLLNDLPGGDAISSVFFGGILSSCTGLPFLFRETEFTTTAIVSLLILGVFQVAVAYICLCIGLKTTPPITASLVSGIEPILNPILVAVFYHEVVGTYALVGAAIVIVGVVGYNVLKAKQEKLSV